jgi:transglutaminase-like putative cysteine protease
MYSRDVKHKLKRVPIRRQEDRINLIEGQVRTSLFGSAREDISSELEDLRRLVIQDILVGVPDRNDEAQAEAVWHWTRETIRYIPDPWDLDLYPTAMSVHDVGAGDCDCHAILNAALLAVIGFPVGLRMIQTDEAGGSMWHVYNTLWLPRDMPTHAVAFDTSWDGAADMGSEWDPDRTQFRQEYVLELRRS